MREEIEEFEISRYDTGVSDEAAALGAHNGCAREEVSELVVGFDGEDLSEGEILLCDRNTLKVFDMCRFRADIVRTDVLTEVTTEKPVADFWAELFGNGAAIFNGEIGDTKIRVNGSVWLYGSGWTNIDAPSTTSTLSLPLGWFVGSEIERRNNFREKHKRAVLSCNHTCVFSDES